MSFVRPGSDDPSHIEDQYELQEWLDEFREGSSMIRLCIGCGLPLFVYYSIGEWISDGSTCNFCSRRW